MADNPKAVGKGDRIRVSQQKHEVQHIAKKFKISGQAASGAIRAAGPMRRRSKRTSRIRRGAAPIGDPKGTARDATENQFVRVTCLSEALAFILLIRL
jgi:hypothetical protein